MPNRLESIKLTVFRYHVTFRANVAYMRPLKNIFLNLITWISYMTGQTEPCHPSFTVLWHSLTDATQGSGDRLVIIIEASRNWLLNSKLFKFNSTDIASWNWEPQKIIERRETDMKMSWADFFSWSSQELRELNQLHQRTLRWNNTGREELFDYNLIGGVKPWWERLCQ